MAAGRHRLHRRCDHLWRPLCRRAGLPARTTQDAGSPHRSVPRHPRHTTQFWRGDVRTDASARLHPSQPRTETTGAEPAALSGMRRRRAGYHHRASRRKSDHCRSAADGRQKRVAEAGRRVHHKRPPAPASCVDRHRGGNPKQPRPVNAGWRGTWRSCRSRLPDGTCCAVDSHIDEVPRGHRARLARWIALAPGKCAAQKNRKRFEQPRSSKRFPG